MNVFRQEFERYRLSPLIPKHFPEKMFDIGHLAC